MPEMPEQHEQASVPMRKIDNESYARWQDVIEFVFPLQRALVAMEDRALTAEARVGQLERSITDSPSEERRLRRAIDDALGIIAGGNPDLPAEVLAEVEAHLQEAHSDNHSRYVPDK